MNSPTESTDNNFNSSLPDTSISKAGGIGVGAGNAAKPVLFVLFLGGISHLEIAALRLLSKDPFFPFQITIGTTSVLNGVQFLKSLEYTGTGNSSSGESTGISDNTL